MLGRVLGLALVAAAAVAVWVVLDRLPPQHSPFAALDLNDATGWATGAKIASLRGDGARCLAVLKASHVAFTPLAERRTGAGCGYFNAVTVNRSTTPYSRSLDVTCAMAAALYLWERDVLIPAAQRHFGTGLARIEHVGTYACRPINGITGGRASEHATANAIDIVGFRVAGGRTLSVETDWGLDTPEGRFLADARRGACRLFRAVLTPDYNRRHRDHLHLDLGRYKSCR